MLIILILHIFFTNNVISLFEYSNGHIKNGFCFCIILEISSLLSKNYPGLNEIKKLCITLQNMRYVQYKTINNFILHNYLIFFRHSFPD